VTAIATTIAVAGVLGVWVCAGALLVIAHNLNVLKIEIRYIFDLWQEHDTRWRQS
jgi:hypothetical protein